MTKKAITLSVVALILAVVYAIYFTDWFEQKTIRILSQPRHGRASAIPRGYNQPAVTPVSFAFDGKYSLTCVKVLSRDEMATNKNPMPLWHMISDKGSEPTKSLMYGLPVKGMKPSLPRARPQPLLPDVPYVLIVEAGKYRGQTDFRTKEYVPPGQQ